MIGEVVYTDISVVSIRVFPIRVYQNYTRTVALNTTTWSMLIQR